MGWRAVRLGAGRGLAGAVGRRGRSRAGPGGPGAGGGGGPGRTRAGPGGRARTTRAVFKNFVR